MAEEMKNSTGMTPEEDYRQSFMPSVHKIGRFTQCIAVVLNMLPALYFIFVAGYRLPNSYYIATIATVLSMGLSGVITETPTYWPMLGSASTYMGFFSGNVSGMRFPVAMSVQKEFDADINTPRGQVVTIVGVAVSIFVNLVILAIILIFGEWLLSILPTPVLSAFSYVTLALTGCMLVMNINIRGGVVKGSLAGLPYFAIGCIGWFLFKYVITGVAGFAMGLSVLASVLFGYIKYRGDRKKFEDSQNEEV